MRDFQFLFVCTVYCKVKISLGIASVRPSSKKLELFFFKFDGAFTAAMQEKQMVFVRMRQLISNFFRQTT